MERVNKTDKSFQFFFGAGCGSKTIIYVAAKKIWFGTVELIENLFFHTAKKNFHVLFDSEFICLFNQWHEIQAFSENRFLEFRKR